MKNSIAFILVFLICLSLTRCRKEAPSIDTPSENGQKDSLIYKDVKGMVFNLCTDSGIAGVKVYLEIYQAKKLVKKYSGVSGEGGTFLFKDAELHLNKEFTYNIYIPSKSGIMAKDAETCGIQGGSYGFTLDEVNNSMNPRVIPSFISLSVYFMGKHLDSSDSIITRFTQNTYHKNVPDYPYKFALGKEGSPFADDFPNTRTGLGNYPMGLYHIVVDKWVSGVHTQWKDSLFTNYGDTAAYVVHW